MKNQRDDKYKKAIDQETELLSDYLVFYKSRTPEGAVHDGSIYSRAGSKGR